MAQVSRPQGHKPADIDLPRAPVKWGAEWLSWWLPVTLFPEFHNKVQLRLTEERRFTRLRAPDLTIHKTREGPGIGGSALMKIKELHTINKNFTGLTSALCNTPIPSVSLNIENARYAVVEVLGT